MGFPHLFGIHALGLTAPATVPVDRRVAARLELSWADTRRVASLSAPWAMRVSAAGSVDLHWSEALAARCELGWAGQVARRLALSWGVPTPVARRLAAPWSLTAPVAARGELRWALRERNPVAATCRMPWAVKADSRVTDPTVTLTTADGRWLRPLRASVTLAEGSPYWSATITLGSDDDAARMRIGDSLSLSLCGESFALCVDAVQEDAQGPVIRTWQVQALSPLAWRDTPHALAADIAFPAGTMASEAVASLLAPLDVAWALPDWTLPSAGLTFTAATPLAAARAIVEAIGGLLESRPDGGAVARRRWPVPPGDMDDAPVGTDVSDAEALERSVATVSVERVNRLTVGDGSGVTAAQDRLEYEPDNTRMRGVVRAWPSPWRPVVLAHTGRPSVGIVARGERAWVVDELVEFRVGEAQLGMPAEAVLSVDWRYADLGEVALDGSVLRTAFGDGYSLALIRYRTRAYVWEVSGAVPEEVQFVLEDV